MTTAESQELKMMIQTERDLLRIINTRKYISKISCDCVRLLSCSLLVIKLYIFFIVLTQNMQLATTVFFFYIIKRNILFQK